MLRRFHRIKKNKEFNEVGKNKHAEDQLFLPVTHLENITLNIFYSP